MTLIRKFIFYLFCLIYITVCPATIFYALGFVLKPGKELTWVKTGLIYIATSPSDAEILLNGVRDDRKSPVVMRDLLPGYYTVEIQKPGYRPWKQIVPVEAEKASALEHVVLLPEKFSARVIQRQPIKDLVPIPETPYLLLFNGQKVRDVTVFDAKGQSFRPLVPVDFLWKDSPIQSFHYTRDSAYVLLRIRTDQYKRFYRIHLEGKDPPKDLTGFFLEEPEWVSWQKSNEDHLFAYQNGTLSLVRSDKMILHPKMSTHVKGFGISDSHLYILRKDHTLVKTDLEGKDEKFLLKDASLGQTLFGGPSFFQIHALMPDLLIFPQIFLFQGSQGELVSNRLPYVFTSEKISGFAFHEKTRQVAVWNQNRIGIMDFGGNVLGEEFFERGPRLNWLYTKGTNVQQAFWAHDGSHLLFRDGQQVKFLDLETFNKPVVHELFEIKPGTQIGFEPHSGIVYFLDSKTHWLEAVELIPRQEIPLPFPKLREKLVWREIKES